MCVALSRKSVKAPLRLRRKGGTRRSFSPLGLIKEFPDFTSGANKRGPQARPCMTVPGIVAHQSALKDGEQLSVPQFERTKA